MSNLAQEDREKEKKRKLMLIVLTFVLIIAAFASIGAYHKHQERVAAEQKKKAGQKYKENLSSAYNQMVAAGSMMEDIINGYTEVWHAAIWNNGATIEGQRYTDFNMALAAQMTSYDTNGDLATVEATMTALDQKMDKLKNPPAKFKDEYAVSLDAYTAVKDMNTYVNPSGSYQTYSQITNEKDNELASKLNSLEVRID
ncbi:hypothetical protein AS52_03678 [Priestia megaterium Q3]|uniref:Uncharacterized protein n=1 Tax=Priestia megaterium Q3 TaxID=1452722 RepID=A0A806TSC1_PRIMG|nr:hypothetical protein [Priestia megaterium]AKP78639.1 hypothetical protein AS52_03678 [Priestia megaterium Q3]